MKPAILLFLFLFIGGNAFAQTQTVEPPLTAPDGKTLDAPYFKPNNVFYKLTWIDKDGKVIIKNLISLVRNFNQNSGSY